MTLPEAIAIVRATPADKRSEYAKEIWRIRRQRYGPEGRGAVSSPSEGF